MTDTTSSAGATPAAKLGVWTLSAIVVGSMVGAGVFSLPAAFAGSTGVVGALIAWGIAGLGMLTLAFAFQALAVRKPQLDAGIYAYAKAGFGEYAGFFSAFGYWASACVGNVTYWVLIMSTLGAWFPALGNGDTVLAIVLSSAGLWGFFLLVRRGVREAAAVNRIVTVAKLVPIVVFVLIALFALQPEVFAENLSGTGSADTGSAGTGSAGTGSADTGSADTATAPLFEQVRGTMLVTVFVFIGVEGASVYSRHARRRRDVGRATLLGFLSVFAIFASVTIVSYGVLPADEIAALRQPSMAGVLESVVGPWGAVLVSAGLIVSVLGAYLAWTLMAAEVMFVAAKDGDMPRFLARQSANDVPTSALLSSTVLAQVFLLLTLFSNDAFTFALNLTSALVLIPFLLVAAYLLKIAVRGDGYGNDNGDEHGNANGSGSSSSSGNGSGSSSGNGSGSSNANGDERGWGRARRRELVIGALATLYVAFLLFAAGLTYVLVSFLIYAPATVFFAMARREQGRRVFSRRELVIFAASIVGAVFGVLALVFGWISV